MVVLLERPDVVYVDASGNVFSSPAAGRQAIINTPGGGASGGARLPDLIPGRNPYAHNGNYLLDPAAFAMPQPGSFGNLSRGALRGRGLFKVDLAITRHLLRKAHEEKFGAEIKVEMFNLFNRVNFNNPSASLPSALGTSVSDHQQPGAPFTRATAKTFGVFTAADPGRQIQFSLILKLNGGFF